MKKWVASAAVVIVSLLGLLHLYEATLITVVQRWTLSDAYSHGYIAAAMAVYLVYRNISLLPAEWRTPQPQWLGLGLLVAAGFLWYLAEIVQVLVIQQMLLPVILWAWVYAVFGKKIARAVVFPSLLLYFTVPVWDVLTDPLRQITVFISSGVLKLIDIPAYIDGFYIHVPAGTFVVAGGCSGLNYFTVALLVSVVDGHLDKLRWPKRILLVGLAVLLGLLSNWFRVTALVLIGYYTEMQSDLVAHHGAFGWWVFAGAMIFYILLSRRIHLRSHTEQANAQSSTRISRVENLTPPVGPNVMVMALLAIVLAGGFPLLAASGKNIAGYDIASIQAKIPLGAIEEPLSWVPAYESYDALRSWRIPAFQDSFGLTVVSYYQQYQGKELIHYKNHLGDSERLIGRVVLNPEVTVNQSVVRGTGRKTYLVFWFYAVGELPVLDEKYAKLAQLLEHFRGHHSAHLVALSLRCQTLDCSSEVQSPRIGEDAAEILAPWFF